MITPRFRPAVGGVERHVDMVVRELLRLGFQIVVLTSSHMRGLPRQEWIGQVRVLRIPYGWERAPPLVYTWVWTNRKIFKSCRIVHVHDTIPLLAWYLPFIHNRTASVFLTFHGYERDPVPTVFRILRRIAKRLVLGALCIGHFIPKVYNTKCEIVLTGAVDCSVVKPTQQEGAIFIGRLEHDTGIIEYIEALRILKETHDISLPLTVCGAGSIEKEAAEMAASLGVNVRFLGIVDNPIELMTSKQICLAAGYLSMLEAMSLGLPVIGIARSSLRAEYLKGIVKDGGVISIQTTAEGVAKEIARLIENPQLAQGISAKGRKFAESMSWKRMVRAYLDLWTGGSQTPKV
jgi:glycosyltransferase involved in cell wall biosynthesis